METQRHGCTAVTKETQEDTRRGKDGTHYGRHKDTDLQHLLRRHKETPRRHTLGRHKDTDVLSGKIIAQQDHFCLQATLVIENPDLRTQRLVIGQSKQAHLIARLH